VASAQSSGNKPDETTASALLAENPSPGGVERGIADDKNNPLAIGEATGEGRVKDLKNTADGPITLASADISGNNGITDGSTRVLATLAPGSGEDLVLDKPMLVKAGTYNYGYINIVDGGSLEFADAKIDFWTKSILVENGGSLKVGDNATPVGTLNEANTVTFHLYGGHTDLGIGCYEDNCGVPASTWTSNGQKKVMLPGQSTRDYFYAYQKLPGDTSKEGITGGTNKRSADQCYFGRKVIAVSYGGGLAMFGRTGQAASWVRLAKSVKAGDTTLQVDGAVNWRVGDQIVVTTTDFLPGHSELHQIAAISPPSGGTTQIILTEAISYAHNGAQYQIPKDAVTSVGLNRKTVETRAAVALLTRNVRIVSEGPSFNTPLPAANDPSDERYFGGHTIARQGFLYFEMKGVELYQMGQGGRMAHTPVNFYLTRTTPPPSYAQNCSIWDSMNRWIELRGTQGVTLEGNVGYLSIGHGYSLADGTETHNALVANIGIYARPAVTFNDNPRTVPGILAKADPTFYNGAGDLRRGDFLGFGGDYIHPSVFFIMNGYNQFEGNMAVGAGTCGSCYWIAPAVISGPSKSQSWEGYAGIQTQEIPGAAPIQEFKGNFCSTAQQSLITIGTTATCKGLNTPDQPTDKFAFTAITNPFDAEYAKSDDIEGGPNQLYPNISSGGLLQSMSCDETGDPACSKSKACTKGQTKNCVANVIGSYTSSFHWAQQNFAAIWLRQSSFLFTDGALTDVLNGGLTMVSGGSWDQVLNKYWGLTRKTVFIGTTQPNNPYASNMGPVNPNSDLLCDMNPPAAYCLLMNSFGQHIEGINIPLSNFGVYQRLYNIYDGPVYQESNAYLDIKKTDVTSECSGKGDGNCNGKTSLCGGKCNGTNFLYARIPGIPHETDPDTGTYKTNCIQPNAAIGWKQPNGFYYPPAFHSNNLFFENVDVRHYVIVPVFKPGTDQVDAVRLINQYCSYPGRGGSNADVRQHFHGRRSPD
jgi:hypothetical protein